MPKLILSCIAFAAMSIAVISILLRLPANNAIGRSVPAITSDLQTTHAHLSKLEIETIADTARNDVGGGSVTTLYSGSLNSHPVWDVQVKTSGTTWTVFLDQKSLNMIQKLPI